MVDDRCAQNNRLYFNIKLSERERQIEYKIQKP